MYRCTLNAHGGRVLRICHLLSMFESGLKSSLLSVEIVLDYFPKIACRLANARRAHVKRNLALICYIFTLIHF